MFEMFVEINTLFVILSHISQHKTDQFNIIIECCILFVEIITLCNNYFLTIFINQTLGVLLTNDNDLAAAKIIRNLFDFELLFYRITLYLNLAQETQ